MSDQEVQMNEVQETEAPAKKRRGGRRPMSEAERAEAAKAREKAKAMAASMVPELYFQYAGREIDASALVEAARADFKSQKKRTPLTGLRLYIKPEENTAYYVANESIEGKIEF